jgi:hypothetical protein
MAALTDVEATATFSEYKQIALVVMITNSRTDDAPLTQA